MLFNSSILRAKNTAKKTFSLITVEPLMLLDGLAFSNMHVYIENLQMDRVCRVSAGYSEEVCANLKAQPDASVLVQHKFSVFALYNGIIAAALPLFFILFMGAWSDKYGRKVPLVAVELGHALHAAGYLLASMEPSWPAEFLLLVTLLDTLGGGAVSFITAANSYISDISSEESRTSRVGLANSIWFLGGPAGTLLGTHIYSHGGYLPLFATSLTFSLIAIVYVIFFLPESHGPFAKRIEVEAMSRETTVHDTESETVDVIGIPEVDISFKRMACDFFRPRCILESFKSTFRKREGNTRVLILLLIFTTLLRRLTRSPYVFAFTRHVLGWNAKNYSFWVTYKNLMATLGSLVAVPLLSGRLGISDNILAMVGAMSGVLDYLVYGCISHSQPYLIWAAPVAALLLNSCNIAQRAMMTKFVTNDEIGKVSAVLGALDGMMPMVNSAVYTAVYHASVSAFPSAHFFLGAGVSFLMMGMFSFITVAETPDKHDVEEAKSTPVEDSVWSKSLIVKPDSLWMDAKDTAIFESAPQYKMIGDKILIPGLLTSNKECENTESSNKDAVKIKISSKDTSKHNENFTKNTAKIINLDTDAANNETSISWLMELAKGLRKQLKDILKWKTVQFQGISSPGIDTNIRETAPRQDQGWDDKDFASTDHLLQDECKKYLSEV